MTPSYASAKIGKYLRFSEAEVNDSSMFSRRLCIQARPQKRKVWGRTLE
jgi:hypothetical protein